MNYKILNIIIVLALFIGVFSSCEDDEGMLIIPEVEEVQFLSGNERAKLVFQSQLTESTKEIVIFWNNLQQEKVISVNQNPTDTLYEVMMDNMVEGDIEFNIYVRDELDNKSQLKSARGHIYGDKYAGGLQNRLFIESAVTPEKVILRWEDSPVGASSFEIEYLDNDDNMNSASFEPLLNIISLENAKAGSKIKFRVKYLPEVNAIDSFYTSWKELEIGLTPMEEFKLDITSILEYHLTNDNPGDAHGGSIAKLSDSIVNSGNFFHTSSSFEGLGKMTFTLDLGQSVVLSKFIIWPRPYFPDRMMKDFDVWAIDDITDADTETPETDVEGWDAEMISNGWTKVASLVIPDYDGDPRSYNDENPYSASYLIEEDREHTYRYVRFMVKSTFVPSAEFCLGEIEVFGKR